MKRFSLAVLLVAAVAAAAFFALSRPGVHASPDATITVNGTHDNTFSGDGVLTLRESPLQTGSCPCQVAKPRKESSPC